MRQNKYNVLKILVKLQVGLKQRDVNMALLHAVKAGTDIAFKLVNKIVYSLWGGNRFLICARRHG